ncbi:MAG: DUF6434 domain-containing protein [Bacteroidota bacterium]
MADRPSFAELATGDDFLSWYWLKAEMVQYCKAAGLPHNGSKFELRDRIAYALDHDGAVLAPEKKKKPTSTFDWANAELTLDTLITDNVSFGPNFRGFMESEIGPSFVCHGDFMDWVKANIGKTLSDAVAAWRELEGRKKDPAFRREIRSFNMYNQYTRDFLDDNPGSGLALARSHWDKKKRLPAPGGFVKYERSDLEL